MSDFYRLPSAEQAGRMEALARAALAEWDIGTPALRLIKYRENAVFEVSAADGRRYALRIHRSGYRTDAELRSELQWMRALAADGFDVPALVPARAGTLFAVARHAGIPEPRHVDLFEWVPGRQLGSIEAGLSGDPATHARTFRIIGVLAARLHAQAARWSLPTGFARHAWDAAGLVGEQPFWGRFWELAALTDTERALLVRARDRMRVELGALVRSPRVYGLIHADIVPENILIDGERLCVIDFDDAGFGWHMFELATSLYFQLGEAYFGAIRDALIEGYRSVHALSDADLALLPLFLAARGTTYLGWVHTRPETETAREQTPMLIERACRAASEYLGAI